MSTAVPGAGDPMYVEPDELTFYWGMTAFAAITLTTMGILQLLSGFAALGDADIYADNDTFTYALDLTTWGRIHVAIGALATVIGLGILARQTLALAAGVAIAFLAACINFVFIPYYPLWSLTLIAFNVLVTWALTRQLQHGRRAAAAPDQPPLTSRP